VYAIETRKLSKTYRDFWGRARIDALKSLDLQVKQGEVFGLLGPNGSGKTTTIKLLLGLSRPTSGHATVLGKPAGHIPTKARIGFLPEESYFHPFLNAEETLDFYGSLFRIPRRERRRRIDELISMAGLADARRRPLKEYSKGMARRIGLAQALINDPDLILLDEPTSGLDPIGTHEVKDLVRKLAGRGKTVLLCSHLLADVEQVCDRIALLVRGRLCAQGAVGELLADNDALEVVLAHPPADALRRIRALAEEMGAGVERAGAPLGTLEDLFIRIVRREDDARRENDA